MQRMYSPWRDVYMQTFKEEKPIVPEEGKSVFADIPPEQDEERFVLCRGEYCFAILNLYPYNCGHLMVIPYLQTPEFSDLDEKTMVEIFKMSNLCMEALKIAIKPHGFNFGANLGRVAGGSIDEHIHFHIVPRWEGDTNFMPVLGDTKVLSNDLRKTYIQLREAIQQLQSEQKEKP
ncbi:HIT family hydrolase [Chlorobaculum limnaeum]|uniref:HIT family hydrolase n=1 Tax=Chlorobaculum limnaeum TaxID=274537 RepID=A0A1D8D1G6_CHLLM|nr:HIT domain-containing protein [Chlorobaculum limnaeum]AOS83973.1 HIT family hydrolase [Chlorobaculum limnaeum]